MTALERSTEEFIPKAVLKGPYPVGGKEGASRRRHAAHPEIKIMEHVTLRFVG